MNYFNLNTTRDKWCKYQERRCIYAGYVLAGCAVLYIMFAKVVDEIGWVEVEVPSLAISGPLRAEFMLATFIAGESAIIMR